MPCVFRGIHKIMVFDFKLCIIIIYYVLSFMCIKDSVINTVLSL